MRSQFLLALVFLTGIASADKHCKDADIDPSSGFLSASLILASQLPAIDYVSLVCTSNETAPAR